MQDTTRPARCAPAARDRRLPNTPVSLAEAVGRGAAACPRARATDRRAGASRGLCGGGADGGRPRYPCMRVWQVAGPSRGAQRAGRVVAVRDFWACGQGGCGAEPVRDGALPGVMGRNDLVTASARWRLCLLGGGRYPLNQVIIRRSGTERPLRAPQWTPMPRRCGHTYPARLSARR